MSRTDPLIEVLGIWIPNKGAELMALATVQALGRRLPGVRFCSAAQGPANMRRDLGIPGYRQPGPVKRRARKILKGKIGARLAPVPRDGVTHFLDVSGFAYGDQWGYRKAQRRAGNLIREGRRVLFVPQAFGPFEEPRLRAEMTAIVAGAANIAARDRQSQAILSEIAAGRDIPQVPDITIGLDIPATAGRDKAQRYVSLIPNAKMIDTGALDRDRFMTLLGRTADTVTAAGLEPVVVLHEPVADAAIGEDLAKARSLRVVSIDNALDLKAFVAGSHCVVSARFHGLVNGLSSGVPSFAIGWSHKYDELLSDFGFDGNFEGDTDAFVAKVEALLRDPTRTQTEREKISAAAHEQKQRVSAFWDQLADMIGSG